MRPPTQDELATLRRLGAEAGGRDALIRWVRLAYRKRAPGRPLGASHVRDFDEVMLAATLAASRISGRPWRDTLRAALAFCGVHGASRAADLDRLLYRKSRK